LCKFRAYLQGGKVQISPVGGSGRTLPKSIGQLAFCKHKAFKHDRKMHKVLSENRTQSIKRVAEQISDSEMFFKVTSEDFAENALYH
jgi:hypothetical protein